MATNSTQWGAAGSPPAVVRWLISRLPEGTVLNLGAGSTGDHVDDDRRTLVGIDLVVRPPAPSGARLVCADAASLPFADGRYDGALCKDIIEHTWDPIGVLREVHRVCRPGARVVVTVPRAIPRAVWADPTHVRGFTRHALTTALTQSGWTIDEPPQRFGGFPGAGRLGLEERLVQVMRIPGFGHWFGTNWFVVATRT